MSELVRYEVVDGVANVTLDSPESRNALSARLVSALAASLRKAADDDAVRCVVLRSSHESVWCAGGDLNTFTADRPLIQKHLDAADVMDLFELLSDLPKPTLAAVAGHALAGGMGLAACCDLVIASETVTFGTPEINIGAFPFMIMAVIYRNMPRKRANEMLMLGDRMSAHEAHELGFVNRVVPSEELDDTVDQWARALAAKSPLIMRLGKEAMTRQRDLGQHQALEYLRAQLTLAQSTDDIREGVAAFFEKRDPIWRGQ